MEAKLGKAGKQAFEIANLLDDAADAIRERSRRDYREGRMSLGEYMEARARELELRGEVSVIVATDLSGVLEEVAEAGENVQQAIRNTKARIEAVRSVRSALETVGSLLALASALSSGHAILILKAGRTLFAAAQ